MCDTDYVLKTVLSNHSSVSFKNIFCFMCNPSYFDDDLISNCIKPSFEQNNDKTFELSCDLSIQKYILLSLQQEREFDVDICRRLYHNKPLHSNG